jgi:Flp pilus assembly protein TadG
MLPIRKSRQHNKGNAFIEFALAASILLPVFLGTFQFGMAFFYYNELVNSVRAAARYAGMRNYQSPTSTPSTEYLTTVKNVAVYGHPAGGTTPVVPGLTPENIQVTVTFTDGVPAQVRVALSNFSMNVIVKRMTLSKPSSVFPYLGVYMPAL